MRASRKIFLSFRPQGAGEMGLTRKICGRKVILACGLRAKTHFGLRVAGDPPPRNSGGGGCTRVGGLTKKLQALDISVNKSFKSKLRAKWEEWMINTAKHTYTRSGKMRHASLQEVCNWIVESWKDMTPECILSVLGER